MKIKHCIAIASVFIAVILFIVDWFPMLIASIIAIGLFFAIRTWKFLHEQDEIERKIFNEYIESREWKSLVNIESNKHILPRFINLILEG